MTDKTHQLIGVTAALGTFLAIHPNQPVTWLTGGTLVIGAMIGSITPDLDQPTAHFWRQIPVLGHFAGEVTSHALGGHRNLSHSILGVGLFYVLSAWALHFVPASWPVDHTIAQQSLLIGFIAHLAADAVTVMGIPLLWPFGSYMGFPPFPFEGLRIETGKWFENLVVFPLALLALGLVVWLHPNQFCGLWSFLCRA